MLRDTESLTTLIFEKGINLDTIPPYCFEKNRLATLELPKSVRTLRECSFHRTNSLKKLTYEAGTELATIEQEAFWSTGLTEFSVPPKLTVLGPANFFESPDLTKIQGNTDFHGENDVLLDKARSTLYLASRSIKEYNVPPSVKTIGGYVFYQCNQLTKLEIDPKSRLETIGRFAFAFSQIRGIDVPATVKRIDDDCFANCSQLTSVRFAAKSVLESIGHRAFGLTKIELFAAPASLKSIGIGAFANSSLSQARFPPALDFVPYLLFYRCTKLDLVEFQAPYLRIDKKAFAEVPPTAVLVAPKDGKVDFVTANDPTLKIHLDQTGATGFEVSEVAAPPGAGLDVLLLRREDREKDPSFETVSKYKNKTTEQVCSVKELPLETTEETFFKELDILRQLRHPNVIGLVGYYTRDTGQTKGELPFAIVTEWMSKGSLDTLLYVPALAAALTTTQKVKIITGIVLGMRYLHARGVTHGSLKPGNVLLTRGLSCKITDIGSEDHGGNSLTSGVGTSAYMAPEIADGKYGKPADVFAFGIMLWEIVKSEQVYIHTQIVKGVRPDVTGLPENAKRLMGLCWIDDPDQRPTFEAIFDNLRAGNYQLLPDVDEAEIREYVDPILQEEAEHSAEVMTQT
jgi:hypothetical protein